MRFSALIWKNLARRPMRSALTLLALSTAIAAVVALLGIAAGFTQSFADVYAAHSVDIVVSRQGTADRLSSSIDAGNAQRIEQLPQVARTAAVLLETLSLEDQGIYGIPSMGIASESWLLDDYEFTDRIDPSRGQNDRDQSRSAQTVMLGTHLAGRLQVPVGGTVMLFDEPYRVTGIFKSPSTWENGSMIFPITELQHLTDRHGQATYINVVLAPAVTGTQATDVMREIEQLDGKLLAMATSDFVETDTRMQLASAMAWMTSVIALIIGSIGTLNTMLTSVMERTGEIGILRAIGWRKRRVVAMIMCESCGLAIVASLLGCILAVLLTWALAQAPAAKGILHPVIGASILVQGILVGLGIGLLGAALPAWRAARLLPTAAFREH